MVDCLENGHALETYEEAVEREYELEDADLEGRGIEEAEHPHSVVHVVHHHHHHVHNGHPVHSAPSSVDIERGGEGDAKGEAQKPQPKGCLSQYAHKFKGGIDDRLPIPPVSQLFWSWLGSFLSIFALTGLTQLTLDETGIPFIVGSFGASAVLLFALPESKLSQPRSVRVVP
jgi:HPP family